MFALNTFSFLAFIGVSFYVYNVSKKESKYQNNTIKIISLLVLTYNVYKVIDNPSNIPVEFSTVTYFITPVIILLNIKKLEVWAVYSSIMAGFFYYSTMMISGGKIYETYPPISIYTSLFCHGSLYFIGLLKLKTVFYNERESYKVIIGIIALVAWAIYIRPEISHTGRIFIYELIDAVHIKNSFDTLLWVYLPLYYLSMSYLVYLSSKLIFRLNKLLNKDFHHKKNVQINGPFSQNELARI